MQTQTNNRQGGSTEGAEKLQERIELTPAVDVFESPDELLIVADLPGVAKDDLTLHIEKSQLLIEGKRAFAEEKHSHVYSRAFVVPNGIDADAISAEIANGVLRLRLPKSAALKPRTIQVKAG